MSVTAPLFLPVAEGPLQPVDIVLIRPAGFPDSGVFREFGETLLHGFRALGYDAKLRLNTLRFGVPTIMLGAHLLEESEAKRLAVGTIIYNLEQIRPDAWVTTPNYLNMLRRHTIWDYDAANVGAIIAASGNRDVQHVPIGYVPQMHRIAPAAVQDIDVLFYGSITSRRRALFETLAATGVKALVVFRAYGEERDALIARSKVVLNLHAFDNWGFEIVRVSYLLANRKAVVCEAASPSEIDADLRDAVRGVPYDRLVAACVDLIRDETARRQLEADGFAAFSRRDEAAILQRALTAPPTPAPEVVPVAAEHGARLRSLYLDLLARSLTSHIADGDEPFNDPTDGRAHPEIRRFDSIRRLFAAILAAGVPGDLIEAGIRHGSSCVFMRGLLKAYDIRDRRVWVAESFTGLAAAAHPQWIQERGDRRHAHLFSTLGLAAARASFDKLDLLDEQVVFLEERVGEAQVAAPLERLALLRLDQDTYGSTMDILSTLYHKVSLGGFVMVEDWAASGGCRAAVADFHTARGITAPIENIEGLGVYWQVPP